MKKSVVIAGGTGFIGSYLSKRFREEGFPVKIISRKDGDASWKDQQAVVAALESAELLINLAGKPITGKFTEDNQKTLVASRVNTTEQLGNALLQCHTPPPLWINASGAHIYGTGDAKPHTESDPADKHFFLAVMAKQWEDALFRFHLPHTRQVAFRIPIVLGKDGGVLQPFVRLTRWGLGGTQGDGRQKFSWVHIEDYYRIIRFVMERKDCSGPVNIGSPYPVDNEELMQTLRRVMHRPVGIPAPAFLIKAGTALLGMESDLILKSLWVMPQELHRLGFTFRFPELEGALRDILD